MNVTEPFDLPVSIEIEGVEHRRAVLEAARVRHLVDAAEDLASAGHAAPSAVRLTYAAFSRRLEFIGEDHARRRMSVEQLLDLPQVVADRLHAADDVVAKKLLGSSAS
jgi:hypothetical protein